MVVASLVPEDKKRREIVIEQFKPHLTSEEFLGFFLGTFFKELITKLTHSISLL